MIKAKRIQEARKNPKKEMALNRIDSKIMRMSCLNKNNSIHSNQSYISSSQGIKNQQVPYFVTIIVSKRRINQK